MSKNKKNAFISGAITPEFICNSIAKHQSKTNIGAHQIFLGQVRSDQTQNGDVVAIDYSCYTEMANEVISSIRENTFEKFDLVCMHIYHSLGVVKAGEISLFVFVSSKHREEANKAVKHVVEEIKFNVPIFGKELFKNQTHQWKVNN